MIDFAALEEEGYIVNQTVVAEYSDEELQMFVDGLKIDFFEPGKKVRIAQRQVDLVLESAMRRGDANKTMESLRNAGDRHFEVESVFYNSPFEAGYRLKGVDLPIMGMFITDARPTRDIFGLVIFQDDRSFAVELDGVNDNPKVLSVTELLAEMENGFGGKYGVSSLAEFKVYLENDPGREHPAISGQFTLADTGGLMGDVWGLSALAWASEVSDQEMAVAEEAIAELRQSGPSLN